MYNAYLNKLLFKYKHFRGVGGLRPCLFCLFREKGSRIGENMLIIILGFSLPEHSVDSLFYPTFQSYFCSNVRPARS